MPPSKLCRYTLWNMECLSSQQNAGIVQQNNENNVSLTESVKLSRILEVEHEAIEHQV